MGACYGPCCLEVDPLSYRKIVDEVILFLKGRTPDLIRKIRREMEAAVQNLAFEEAAQLRDRMRAMEMTLEKQRAVTKDLRDRDIITIATGDHIMVNVLAIRGGYLQGSRNFEISETLADPAELLSGFIRQFYPPGAQCPHEILTPLMSTDAPLLEDWFRSEHAQTVKIIHPQRGDKKRLLEMGYQNAEKALRERMADQTRRQSLMASLGRRLRLMKVPRRIECFDNSNLFGQSPVAGMVVFEDGRACRSQYRKFSIRTVGKPDDYASMEEILQRRFSNHPEWPFPDILLLDGGKGQLNIALDVIDRLGIGGRFALAAIAKKEVDRGESHDKIYIPHRANPVNFTNDDAARLFLQQIRDEAHRFAISFHRQKRTKKAFVSGLDGIPGIGPLRKQALMRHFGSLNAIRAATLDELSALPGMNRNAAETLYHRLASDND
jgi:excinuclease ABC subunit C